MEAIDHPPIFRLPGIPDHVTYTWLVMVILATVTFVASRNLQLVPRGIQNFLEVVLVVFVARGPQYGPGFVHSSFLDQPARAAWNGKQHHEEQGRGEGGDAEFPAPFGCSDVLQADDVIRKVGDQNAEDYVELKESH